MMVSTSAQTCLELKVLKVKQPPLHIIPDGSQTQLHNIISMYIHQIKPTGSTGS
jgi:hypothetical protein